MKRVEIGSIFPMNKGLDLSAVPGSQDRRALTKAKNIVLRTRPSLKKRPGIRRINHVGANSEVQNAIQWFATKGGAQAEETVRVRNGRIEVLRDTAAGNPQFYDIGS